jgi:hypothetical protein
MPADPQFDLHSNFGITTVLTPPSPPTTGTSIVLVAGGGALFPVAPYNVVVAPAGQMPAATTSEIMRVTARSADTLTVIRVQEGTVARSIIAGDVVFAAITKKTLSDIEDYMPNPIYIGTPLTAPGLDASGRPRFPNKAAFMVPIGGGQMIQWIVSTQQWSL